MGALSGIRVLDFTRVVAGPYCTMLLGDLGAEVVKVEHPGQGDDTRSWGPPFVEGESAYFLGINRNKKSICLDLQNTHDLERAYQLMRQSDVVIENFRSGIMERFGLGYETWCQSYPGLIYYVISGYGRIGPFRQDVIVSAELRHHYPDIAELRPHYRSQSQGHLALFHWTPRRSCKLRFQTFSVSHVIRSFS